jgi:hypothetical protein
LRIDGHYANISGRNAIFFCGFAQYTWPAAESPAGWSHHVTAGPASYNALFWPHAVKRFAATLGI